MKSSIRLCDLILRVYTTLVIAQYVYALPQDTTAPRIYRRGDLPNAPPAYDPDKDDYKRYVSKRCSTDQIASEARGWAEAGVLSNALNAWKPTSDYQNAMNTYMGTDSSSNWGIFWSYRQRVQNAVTNDFKIHHGEQPSKTYIYVYCDEDDTPKEFGKRCGGDTGAYTWDSLGWIWSNHMVVLCPNNFFDETRTPTLSAQLRKIRDDPSMAKNIDSLYWNIGYIYFHETFHWRSTVTDPEALDSDPDDASKAIYGSQAVKDEAAAKNTYANSVIADAYTIAGTAMLLMQTFKLADPPQPLSAATVKVFNIPALGDAPADWVGPQNVSDPNSQPDMSIWQESIKVQIDMADYAPVSGAGGSSAPPTTGTCNCDENSCTDDSPACCANGSCPPSSSAPPTTLTCNCNENGCTDDSPACCASGSCPPSVAPVP